MKRIAMISEHASPLAMLGGVDAGGQNVYVGQLARHLNVPRDTIRRWQRVGWLHSYRDADGYWILWAYADDVARLQALHALPRTWENKDRLAELKRPTPRPQE